MSARAWHRRRRGKRFVLSVKNAIRQLKVDPDQAVLLDEFGLVAISAQYYNRLTGQITEMGKR